MLLRDPSKIAWLCVVIINCIKLSVDNEPWIKHATNSTILAFRLKCCSDNEFITEYNFGSPFDQTCWKQATDFYNNVLLCICRYQSAPLTCDAIKFDCTEIQIFCDIGWQIDAHSMTPLSSKITDRLLFLKWLVFWSQIWEFVRGNNYIIDTGGVHSDD